MSFPVYQVTQYKNYSAQEEIHQDNGIRNKSHWYMLTRFSLGVQRIKHIIGDHSEKSVIKKIQVRDKVCLPNSFIAYRSMVES